MQLKTVAPETVARRSADTLPAKDRDRLRARRRRWVRVRVDTDEGAYVGSLRLDGPTGGLHELVEDDRSYLALWSATHESSGAVEEFVAIHKSAIRLVVLIGASGRRGAGDEEE
jgi:hypothetical protein